MKHLRKLLSPVLALSSLFCGVAAAQDIQKPALPDAPVAQPLEPGRLNLKKLDLTIPPQGRIDTRFEYHAPAFKAASPFGDGRIGKMATYFDQHTNDSQFPFDTAIEYPLSGRIALQGGTLANMRANTGKEMSDRFIVRQMTGEPDWQTVGLRQAMFNDAPGNLNQNGNNGYGIGIKIYLGRKP